MNISGSLILQMGDAIGGVSGDLYEVISRMQEHLDEAMTSYSRCYVPPGSEELNRHLTSINSVMVSIESLAKRFQYLSEVYIALSAQPLNLMAREIEEGAEKVRYAQQEAHIGVELSNSDQE